MSQQAGQQATKRGIPGKYNPKQPSWRDKPSGEIRGFRNLNVRSDDRFDSCTHFISIPFKDANLKKSFDAFRDDLILNYEKYHVYENIIQKTAKLHRTIINLNLLQEKDIDLVKKVLEEEKEALKKILLSDKQGKQVIIKGLQEPRNLMRVPGIYANMRAPVIQRISNHLTEAFERAKIEISSSNPTANRICVINKNLLTDEEKAQRKDYSFNPGPVLRTYKDYEFGSFNLGEIHLSRRKQYDVDGYYVAEKVLRV